MSLFKYRFNDGEEYEIEADYWEVSKYQTVNLRGEVSDVVDYVFYEDGKPKLRIPSWFIDGGSIREVL